MGKSAPRLGRGLSALVTSRPKPEAPPTDESVKPAPQPSGTPADTVVELPIRDVRPCAHQPRTHFDPTALEELAASIRMSGVVQPIIVRRTPGATPYELVAGERRWRAARMADLKTIPALVRDLSDEAALEITLIENLQREDLNPIERATAYQQFIDAFDTSIERLSRRLGESRANISNYLRLLKLDEEVLGFISDGKLSMGHARAIVSVSNPQKQLALARMAIHRNLSVRQVETLAKKANDDAPAAQPARTSRSPHFDQVEQSLSKALGLAVKLVPGKKKNSGRIIIRYDSLEEFDHIAESIGGQSKLE